MQTVPLKVSARQQDIPAKALRAGGQVPLVLYGHDTENLQFQCKYNVLAKAYMDAGTSTLVELDTGSVKVPVLFHAVEFDAVSGRITHVDFFAVNMKSEIEAEVHIRLEGEAPAVKDLGGILITPHDHITVKCLPSDLPHDLPVSLETLTEFGSAVTVADLKLPSGVVVENDQDTVLATVQEPRKEEEVVAAPAEGEAEGTTAAEGEKTAEGEAEKKDGGADS